MFWVLKFSSWNSARSYSAPPYYVLQRFSPHKQNYDTEYCHQSPGHGSRRSRVPSAPLGTTAIHRKHKHHLPAGCLGTLFVCCIFAYHETSRESLQIQILFKQLPFGINCSFKETSKGSRGLKKEAINRNHLLYFWMHRFLRYSITTTDFNSEGKINRNLSLMHLLYFPTGKQAFWK